ncbi:ABC transporter permease subunit [Aeromicrobium sp.]|uniref:ABC transporter permease subunit n=1 Tax=Aeromicrobium sp. TaxID=1871063 RepID=UPI0019BF2FA3|nr:ABC transporter permease subunit [Aeromicrobium sp.]MBC7633471.1 carbohydrate ABC transporter permease [Aeromicrobium sp.]
MIPSVRSRIVASATAFALGFALANYGVFMISGPDQLLWVVAAVVLMLTGALGIVFADTGRAVSVWSILGVEVFAIFTLLPLLWTFTIAVAPAGLAPRAVLPEGVSWSAFDGALHSGILRHAAATSVLVAGLATVVSMLLAIAAAYALVRLPVRGRRLAYGLVVAALLLPLVALAGPLADQLMSFGVSDSRLALVPPMLLITLPLAIWLCVTVMRDVPWSLHESVRADGASRSQVVRRFVVPHIGPGVLVVTLLVFVVGCSDFVLGAALAAGDASRPLPATLLLATSRVDSSSSAVAAAGLLWFLPVLALLLVFPRRITQLLGRSAR